MEWDEGEDPDAVVFGERFGRGSGGRGYWDFEVSLSLPAYVLARDAPVAFLHVSAFIGIAMIHVPVDLRDLPRPGPKGSPTEP